MLVDATLRTRARVRRSRGLLVSTILVTLVGGCGPNVGGPGGDAASLEETWPGLYFEGTQPENLYGSDSPGIPVFEFRDDHIAISHARPCLGNPVNELRWEWRVRDASTIEVLVSAERAESLNQPVGTVWETFHLSNPPCGPHRAVQQNGGERPFVAGTYCPANVYEDFSGQYCDFDPCDDRARACAGEGSDGT
jgi:hypothetical protein